MTVVISSALFPDDTALIQSLWQEYQQQLGIDLAFQAFDAELAGLPGRYARPAGDLVICRVDGEASGCISWYPMENNICEIKRLYVKPDFRGQDIGRRLMSYAIDKITQYGYDAVRLDSLQRLESAKKLYESFDFQPIPPYNHNPLPDVYYMELKLPQT
jgi:putative acetyltransferase